MLRVSKDFCIFATHYNNLNDMKKFILFAFFACTTLIASAGDGDKNDDDNDNVSFVLGYVSKQWSSSKVNGSTLHENMWREEGKRLHGVQFGVAYTPKLPMGLGVYTGLFGEGYFSFSKAMGYDEFTEFSLYVPIHANFTLALSDDVALKAHGGLGLSYACHGGFTNKDAYFYEWVWDEITGYHRQRKSYELDHIRYGKDGWPKRFNAALEINIGIQIKSFLISGGYSWGLTDHQFYKEIPGSSTKQDKLAITVGYEF